jgi:hypothetical protein
MKTVQHHHAMEEDIVQLTEAEILARLSVLEYRQRYLKKAPKAPSAANISVPTRFVLSESDGSSKPPSNSSRNSRS